MNERTIHLKIKVQSLVDEAKTIRKEANKTRGMAKWRLNHHRTAVVRPHTRLNLLAYGILRGTPYGAMERHSNDPNWILRNLWDKAATIAKKFGATEDQVVEWLAGAEGHISQKKQAA